MENSKLYDVFISYRRETGSLFADLIYDEFVNRGIKAYMDREERKSGDFDERLLKVIAQSKNLVILVTKDAFKRCSETNDWVRRELECALKENVFIVPVFLDGADFDAELPESISAIKTKQGEKYDSNFKSGSITNIIKLLSNLDTKSANSRNKNTYFNMQESEINRLISQEKLFEKFDGDLFEKVVLSKENPVVLDIGSNTGTITLQRLSKFENIKKIVGVELVEEAVDYANQNSNDNGRACYYQADVEADDFADKLCDIMIEQGIDGFDIVIVSMVILHLEKPRKMLSVVHDYMKKGGTIIIRDVDDGFTHAYPDPNGDFARAIAKCNELKTCGFRQSGRRIYDELKKADFSNIQLKKFGMPNTLFDSRQKSQMFDVYFSFIKEDTIAESKIFENDQHKLDDARWIESHYDDMKEDSLNNHFFFVIGMMDFTAEA